MLGRAFALAAVVMLAGWTGARALDAESAPIGIARMLPDGTIIMDLFQNDHVATAEGRFTYHPGDHAYKDLLEHLHGLTPGQRKAVPPWPPGEGGPH